MKKALSYLALFLLLTLSQGLSAQIRMSLSGGAVLKAEDTDAAGYYRRMDVNDNLCALIKVRPTAAMSSALVLTMKLKT